MRRFLAGSHYQNFNLCLNLCHWNNIFIPLKDYHKSWFHQFIIHFYIVKCVKSVATRREVLLRNEKSDFVTRSVALRREEVVKYLKIFSLALPALLAACLSRSSRRTWSVTSRGIFRGTSQMFIAFSTVSPALLDYLQVQMWTKECIITTYF